MQSMKLESRILLLCSRAKRYGFGKAPIWQIWNYRPFRFSDAVHCRMQCNRSNNVWKETARDSIRKGNAKNDIALQSLCWRWDDLMAVLLQKVLLSFLHCYKILSACSSAIEVNQASVKWKRQNAHFWKVVRSKSMDIWWQQTIQWDRS